MATIGGFLRNIHLRRRRRPCRRSELPAPEASVLRLPQSSTNPPDPLLGPPPLHASPSRSSPSTPALEFRKEKGREARKMKAAAPWTCAPTTPWSKSCTLPFARIRGGCFAGGWIGHLLGLLPVRGFPFVSAVELQQLKELNKETDHNR